MTHGESHPSLTRLVHDDELGEAAALMVQKLSNSA